MEAKNVVRYYTSSDPRQYRLWSHTQAFASGDQLARCLQEGWQLDQLVEIEKHWFGDARFIVIYRMTLRRAGHTVTMRVMSTPFTRDLVQDERLGLRRVPVDKPAQVVRFAVLNK